jgi:hypothetical protein
LAGSEVQSAPGRPHAADLKRFDSKLDRTTNTFVILGLWLEDEALGNDEAFAEALARGFARFVTFLGASTLGKEKAVDNLDRQVAELKERGLAVGAIETQPGLFRKAEVTDPEGNKISFGQALSPGND